MYKQLRGIDGGQEFTKKSAKLYKGKGALTIKKEALTDFIANIADGTFELTKSNFEKAKEFIYDLLNTIGIKIPAKYSDIRDIESLQDLAKFISQSFAKGEEIKSVDVTDKAKETESANSFRETESKSKLQYQAGDELTPENKDYVSAKKILKEDKDKFNKNPEAVTPEPQTTGKDENKKIKIEVFEGVDGSREVKIVYKTVPYDLEKGALKNVSKIKSKAIDILSDRLVDDYNTYKDRPEISAAIGWYGNMRKWFQKNFGANIEVFGQLLAATSARTEVVDNFKQAVEAMRNLSKGNYDDLLKDYDAHVKSIKSLSDEQLQKKWQEKNPDKKISKFDAGDYRRFLINQYVAVAASGWLPTANANYIFWEYVRWRFWGMPF